MPPTRAVSLSSELSILSEGVEGARLLATQLAMSQHDGTPELPRAVAAMLVLVVERLRLLERVTRGTVDPRLVWCSENHGTQPLLAGDHDILLFAWSDAELVEHHSREWRSARRRVQWERDEKKARRTKKGSRQ